MRHDWCNNIEMGHSKSEYNYYDESDDIIPVLEDLANSWEPEEGTPFVILLDRIKSGEVIDVTKDNMLEEVNKIRKELGRMGLV
jgi:hypothetical protein